MCSHVEVSLVQDCQVLFNGFLTSSGTGQGKRGAPPLPGTPGKLAAQIN